MKGFTRMDIIHRWLIAFLLISLCLIGCSPKYGEMVVLEVGKSKVTLSEYETFFTRNSGGLETARQSSPEERERFLDLLTNYKLKLQDAYERKLQNDSDIVEELREYRSSLASTFMLDRELIDPGVKQMYDRRKEELRAQHILISVKPDAQPADTLAAWTKAMDVIHRIKSGENFDSLALKFSEDPSVKTNRGDLYYFTGGQMVSSFENAVYAMHKDEITSVPVRSTFGYHIIKVLDRKQAPGKIKVRHIMTSFQVSATDSADTSAALNRIKGIQDSLKKGLDFAELATKLSEDKGSAEHGGDLGWFERRRWVQPFDEAAFNLAVGQISGIVRTSYGYHILRCDSSKPVASYAELRDEMKKFYQQHRYNEAYNDYIADLKKMYNYSFNNGTFESFLVHLDSTKSTDDSAWYETVPPELRKQALMVISGRSLSLDTAITILNKRTEYRGTLLRKTELQSQLERIAQSLLIDRKSVGLEDRNPEFGALMKEYEDGVVLYKAEQLEVWNKTSVTDSALKAFYAQNKTKFMFPERVNISEIHVDSDTLAAMIYDSLKHGVNFGDLAARYNDDSDLKAKRGSRGYQPVNTDDLTQHAASLPVGGFSEPLEKEGGGSVIIELIAKEPAREKTLEEAGAEVSNALQEDVSKRLEKDWLDRVKQKHPVIQYKEVLQNAFKSSQTPK
jgi:peptidyl-prolyl cis-trans isomerase SurA